ncbi:hypothetical protein M1349_03405, partial [Patescibacteria group bacterium]|nr:hypothetical protein [Patescibacteria group bacterium]
RQDDRNVFQKIVGFIMGIFGKNPGAPSGSSQRENGQGGGSRGPMPEGAVGPGGCKSQSECDAYCDKPEHREECSKFTPPDNNNR